MFAQLFLVRAAAMERSQLRVVILSLAIMLLFLCAQGQAKYSPGPTAQPGHASSPAPLPFPMYGVTPGSLHPQECPGRCATRCSATAYKKPCMFYCQKCCWTCLCVPSGTYGNKQSCPCYNIWKTKRGGPKCP
ncbi:Gibberellin-regulated family protein [Rhynchospora pubera]|uniref:Gibberellin-regulated family protein n=1 Tax=Rhynchospora pubera TaxID=906938 RepID=A0AAV8E0B4_9POAL|nr:Gibberellin-regulated family protein [Rhynchospora pubera]